MRFIVAFIVGFIALGRVSLAFFLSSDFRKRQIALFNVSST